MNTDPPCYDCDDERCIDQPIACEAYYRYVECGEWLVRQMKNPNGEWMERSEACE